MSLPKPHALFSRRAPALALAGACATLFAITTAVAAPAGSAPGSAPASKTTAKKSGQASKSLAGGAHAGSAPAYTPPPLAPGDTLLARVGDRNITFAGFRDEWFGMSPNQRPMAPDPVIAYKLFLNDIITRELMGVEATRRSKPLTKAQQEDVDSLWHLLTRNQLFVEEVENRVTVDSSQVDRFRHELSHILFLTAYVFPNRDEAQGWYTKIVSGTPVSRLEAAAKQGGPGAPKEVDLGHKIREDFNEETAHTLFTLPPGRLSPPVQTDQGWALLQVTGTRLRPNAAAQGSRAAVFHEMRRMKANTYKEMYRDSLARAMHIAYREAAMDTMVNRFLRLPERTAPREEGGMNYHLFQPLPTLLPGDENLLLATTDEGRVTGGTLYRFLAGMDEVSRPEIRNLDQLRPWVDRVAFDDALLRRAIAQGYDRAPRVLAQVAKRREFYQVQALYEDSVSSTVHLSEKEVRDYYASDTTRWKLEETASIWVCGASSKAEAESLLAVAKGGANLKELAIKNTTLGDFSENGGMSQPFTRSGSPLSPITDAVFQSKEGEFGGPIASMEGWVIFKVMARTPARQRSFDEVKDDATRALRNDREEYVMQLFLGRLAKRIPIEKHEELLALFAGLSIKPGS
jgi:hypothetical protein